MKCIKRHFQNQELGTFGTQLTFLPFLISNKILMFCLFTTKPLNSAWHCLLSARGWIGPSFSLASPQVWWATAPAPWGTLGALLTQRRAAVPSCVALVVTDVWPRDGGTSAMQKRMWPLSGWYLSPSGKPCGMEQEMLKYCCLLYCLAAI